MNISISGIFSLTLISILQYQMVINDFLKLKNSNRNYIEMNLQMNRMNSSQIKSNLWDLLRMYFWDCIHSCSLKR